MKDNSKVGNNPLSEKLPYYKASYRSAAMLCNDEWKLPAGSSHWTPTLAANLQKESIKQLWRFYE